MNLNEKSTIDNNIFWKTVKPALSDKVCTRDRIHVIEKGKIVKTGLETAQIPQISKYSNYEPFIEDNIEDLTLKAVLKYKDRPSINFIQTKCEITLG